MSRIRLILLDFDGTLVDTRRANARAYVETLRDRGELAEMKGLIYFTDGLGSFPEKPPDYDTAFVFMDEEGRDLPPVPPWAMKVVIDEAGINRFKSQGIR